MSVIPYSNGNIPVYRFYISTFSSVTYEVFPLRFLESSLVDQLEPGEVFYRRKFNGSLLFGTNDKVIDALGAEQNRADDFALLWAMYSAEKCTKLYLTITKTVSGVTDTYWEGYFSTSDGDWDLDGCTFEVTPTAYDDYSDILEYKDDEYDILLVSPSVSVIAEYDPSTSVTYLYNRFLIDVIEYLIDELIPGCTVSSDFFTAVDNYVTQKTNKLTYLTIGPKISFINSVPSSCMISFGELMDILFAMFQVKWDYDALTNNLIVEHISYFTGGAGLDLRNQLSCVATNKFSYVKEKMPKYEYFKCMEDMEDNFHGFPIYYDSPCVNQDPASNKKEISIRVTTDLEFIHSFPEQISDDGFVILCNYKDGVFYYVETWTGAFNAINKLNMRLSWANLHQDYFKYNRILLEGFLNQTLTTFITCQKNKKQKCDIILCDLDTFDPSDEITTELGESYFGGEKAVVESAIIQPTGQIELSLLYGEPDNPVPAPAPDPMVFDIDQFNSGDCFELTATFPYATPAGMTIQVKHIIRDSFNIIVCQTAFGDEDWVVGIGETTSVFNMTPCDAIPAGGSLQIEFDYTLAGGWTANFNQLYCV